LQSTRITESRWGALSLLAALAALAYTPLFGIPLLEDDYPNLWQAMQWGSPAQAVALLHNPVFRLRATSFWIMFLLWQVGKVVVHVVNTWLLYGVCRAWPRMRAGAFWAAGFFAIAEGHQEAVMWFSAINELLLFLFGMGTLLCWLKLAARGRGWGLQLVGVGLFALTLLSKESALVILPLLPLAAGRGDWCRTVVRLAPYVVLAGVAVASVAATRSYSFRFSDGSFSLHAPFWITWPRNCFRVLWIWGWPAAAVVFLAGDRDLRRSGLVALAWIGLGLAPYSFLTYSTLIPSCQTYLASAGAALLFGLAMAHGRLRWPAKGRVLAAVAALVLLHNTVYLWTKKRSQYLERAAPTEQLIALARRTDGPIWVRCFPRNGFIAEEAVHLGAGYPPSNLVWSEAEAARRHTAAVFCYHSAE
jgi:hypothetical protein